jgi:2-hydroxyglutaryl-CoA dehydratase, D-component
MTGPTRIDMATWQRRFLALDPAETGGVHYFRHLGPRAFSRYLKPPSSFLAYGFRRLKRLKFDDDLRALRLWAFVLEEGERLYRAKQSGMRVIGLMGDYGAVAPLVYAFPDVTAFYPDFCYWTPFLTESDVLLDRAERRGLGEDTCFVRAAVGAFTSGAYWPEPDLVAASTGASCDDLAAVTQVAFDEGTRMLFLEIPARKDPAPWLTATTFEEEPGLPPRQTGVRERLTDVYRDFLTRAGEALGLPVSEERVVDSVERFRSIRRSIAEIRRLTREAPRSPLGATEELLAQFAATHAYGDPAECSLVLEGVLELVRERAARKEGFGTGDEVRITWVNPPPDPLLHDYVEDRGARIVGTEYLIASALTDLPAGDPVESVARAFLAGSLLGTTAARGREVVETVKESRSEGVIISNLFGSSHCGSETPILRRMVEEECGIPVLSFDVPKPAATGISSQVRNRLDAFLEAILRGPCRTK